MSILGKFNSKLIKFGKEKTRLKTGLFFLLTFVLVMINFFFIMNNFILSWSVGIIIIGAIPFIVSTLCSLIHLIIEHFNFDIEYSEFGSLGNWYNKTMEYNKKIGWIEKVEEQLNYAGIDLTNELIFVSPSGNKGEYEFALSKRYPDTTFVVTDLAGIDNHIKTQNNFVYLDNSNNAFNINNYCYEINLYPIDIIWDIRGQFGITKNLLV